MRREVTLFSMVGVPSGGIYVYQQIRGTLTKKPHSHFFSGARQEGGWVFVTFMHGRSRMNIFVLFFSSHFLISSFWTSRGHRCRPFSPPVLAFICIALRVQQSPLLVDFLSSVANSRSRAFLKSNCAQLKVPTNLYEYALGGARTHETDLYHARG